MANLRISLSVLVLAFVLIGCCLLYSGGAEAQMSRSSKVHDLQEHRLATLRNLVETTREDFTNGLANSDAVWSAIKASEEAQLDLCTSDKERIAVLEKAVVDAKAREEQDAKLAVNKLLSKSSSLKATADRLQQEILLEQARSKYHRWTHTLKVALDIVLSVRPRLMRRDIRLKCAGRSAPYIVLISADGYPFNVPLICR